MEEEDASLAPHKEEKEFTNRKLIRQKLDALLTQYAKLDWAGAEALLRERMQKN